MRRNHACIHRQLPQKKPQPEEVASPQVSSLGSGHQPQKKKELTENAGTVLVPGLEVIVGSVHKRTHEALALKQGSEGSRVTKEGHQVTQRTEEKNRKTETMELRAKTRPISWTPGWRRQHDVREVAGDSQRATLRTIHCGCGCSQFKPLLASEAT